MTQFIIWFVSKWPPCHDRLVTGRHIQCSVPSSVLVYLYKRTIQETVQMQYLKKKENAIWNLLCTCTPGQNPVCFVVAQTSSFLFSPGVVNKSLIRLRCNTPTRRNKVCMHVMSSSHMLCLSRMLLVSGPLIKYLLVPCQNSSLLLPYDCTQALHRQFMIALS